MAIPVFDGSSSRLRRLQVRFTSIDLKSSYEKLRVLSRKNFQYHTLYAQRAMGYG